MAKLNVGGALSAKLLKAVGDFKIFRITESGAKRHVKSPEEFKALGLDWSDVREVSAQELASFPEFRLMRANGDPKVFRVEDGQKIWIKTAEIFNESGFKWGEIETVNPSDLNGLSEIRLVRAENDTKVFKVKDNQKIWIKTKEDFERHFHWGQIEVADDSHVNGLHEVETEVEFEISNPKESPIIPLNTPSPNLRESVCLHDLVIYDELARPYRRFNSVTIDGAGNNIKDTPPKILRQTQSQWIIAAREEGKEIPSLPLLYAIIENIHLEKNPAEAALLTEIKYGFITSSGLDYGAGTIIHGQGFPSRYQFNSHFPKNYGRLREVKNEISWRHFLQLVLQPRDIDQAVKILRECCEIPYVWVAKPIKAKQYEAYKSCCVDRYIKENTEQIYLNFDSSPQSLGNSWMVTLK